MPESMCRDVLLDLGFLAVNLDQLPHSVFRYLRPIHGEEEMVVGRVFDEHGPDRLDVVLDVLAGDLSDRNDPILASFSAVHPDKSLVIVDIRELKVDEFISSDPG